MDTYFYFVEGKPYFNITNRCSNDCDFCLRHNRTTVYDQPLWLTGVEPTTQQVLEQIPQDFDFKQEFTFCGFGEPTYNLQTLTGVAKVIKQNGGLVRLNTNGQGSVINGRDIVGDLKGVVDSVSISLNDCNSKLYQQICHCEFGEEVFDKLLDFAKECKDTGIKTAFSVVDVIGEENVKKCQQLCDKLGIKLRVRKYIPLEQY